MALPLSLILIAIGAILAWAVNVSSSSFDVNTIGYILLAVGIVGALLSLAFWSTWAGPGYFTRRRTYVEDAPARGRRTVVEDDRY